MIFVVGRATSARYRAAFSRDLLQRLWRNRAFVVAADRFFFGSSAHTFCLHTSHFARVATTQQYGMASFAFRVLSFAAMAVAYFGFTFYQLPGPSNIGECKGNEVCRR